SPWRSARSLRPAFGSSAGGMRLSEPALGSEMPLPSRNVSSSTNGRRKRAFCSWLQTAEMRWLHFQFWLKVFAMALSPRASSVITTAWVTKSVPCPPHSFGTAMVRKPSLEPFLMTSQSKVAVGSAIASRASEIGRISSSANFRAVICQSRCSLLSEKSMAAASRSFSREHRRCGAAIVGKRFGDAQLGVACAGAGMQAEERIVYVFLQRHVAHDAHGAEAFRRLLGRRVHRLGGEDLRDGRKWQLGKTAIGKRAGMVRGPGRLPDDGARDLKADRDLGKLRSDRLMLDDAAPTLHPQLRIVERGLRGGTPDAQVQGCTLRVAAGVDKRAQRTLPLGAEQVFSRHANVVEDQLTATAVVPAPPRVRLLEGEARRGCRHQHRAHAG